MNIENIYDFYHLYAYRPNYNEPNEQCVVRFINDSGKKNHFCTSYSGRTLSLIISRLSCCNDAHDYLLHWLKKQNLKTLLTPAGRCCDPYKSKKLVPPAPRKDFSLWDALGKNTNIDEFFTNDVVMPYDMPVCAYALFSNNQKIIEFIISILGPEKSIQQLNLLADFLGGCLNKENFRPAGIFGIHNSIVAVLMSHGRRLETREKVLYIAERKILNAVAQEASVSSATNRVSL